jgi:hypothetical protein
MTAPRYSDLELVEWCESRVGYLRQIISRGPLHTPPEIAESCEHEVGYLSQLAEIMTALGRMRDLGAVIDPVERGDSPPGLIDPAQEYGASPNFTTALGAVIESHTGARAFAVFAFHVHGDGRISVDIVGNIPRAALDQSLRVFLDEGVIMRKPR